MKHLLKDLNPQEPEKNKIIPNAKNFQLIDEEAVELFFNKKEKQLNENIQTSLEKAKQDLIESTNNIEETFNEIIEIKEEIEKALETVEEMGESDIEEMSKSVDNIIISLNDFLRKEDAGVIESKILNQVKTAIKDIDSSIKNVHKNNTRTLKGHSEQYNIELKNIHDRFGTLEELVGKIPTDVFEFGSQLSVIVNGAFAGITSALNFKNGTNTTVTVVPTPQGVGLDVTVNTSGSGLSKEIPTGTINGSNTVFTVQNKTKLLFLNGAYQSDSGVDYTLTGSSAPFTITYVIAPVSSSNHTSIY